MTIVVDARMVNHSGIGVYLRQYMLRLVQRDITVILLGDTNELLKIFGVKSNISYVHFTAPIYSITEQFFLPFKIPRCDIFWSPHYNIPLFPIKARKRIVTIHDVYHIAFKESLNLVQRLYASIFLNSAVLLADKILTVSNFSKSELIRLTGCLENQIFVIHNGIQFSDYSIKNNVIIDEKFILYVGNVKQHKNLKRALQAFSQIRRSKPSLKFYIIGRKEGFINGGYTDLKDMMASLQGSLRFTGWITNEDLINYYQSAELLIFPSIYEGFGLPPVEAMFYGCPTAVADSSSLPEICGDASEYFNPFEIDDMVRAINLILASQERRNELIELGYSRSKLYNWDVATNRLLELLWELHNS
jgi:glycosyltransferase involved in cell wall biosynthesis